MFTPLGLFKDIPCPRGQECSLLTCMFSHSNTEPSFQENDIAQDHCSGQKDAGPPPSKRIKLQSVSSTDKGVSEDTSSLENKSKKPALGTPAPKWPESSAIKATNSRPAARSQSTTTKPNTTSARHDLSTLEKPASRLPPRQAPKETLNPRMLQKSPAAYTTRLAILKKLHSTMSSLNDQLAKDKERKDKSLVLTSNELITMALDEEEKAAKDNPTVYSNVVKLRIVKLSKLGKDEWAKEVRDHLNKRYYKMESNQAQKEPKALTTGLTIEEEIAIAKRLVTPLEGLEQYGYVTKAPTLEEIETAKKGVAESKGWEKCDRCGGRFQVFPGRREDGSLTSGGQCTYHPGKSFYPPRKKTDHVTGHREAYYSCCNETLGTSSGCTKGETHVFKVSETKRLASILQFKKTPENPNKGRTTPIGFDCEMGFTTLGLELIRLTAVSWPEGKGLLDILVRPVGEVLDLNSQFSGVFPEHYKKALPYDASGSIETSSSDIGKPESAPLQVVDSPAAARALLFELLQPTTPLIGHAIDNDLNACRIIHPTVIDTAILYPHPAGGFPYRMSLKNLSKKHLDRDIQTGGNRGHDSKEDAVATGDLVRVKATETWKILKSRGWGIQNGELIPPPGVEDSAASSLWKLGRGAGQKRSNSAEG
ncbi:hypothetical protein ARAM_001860 [Aspergillus rambellii]|uniref:RNA exonuclease 3 n=1 Tax=Aspergillus rambellii TaxID=308745 RepID=A0A0F8UFA8_9EURO|nr:hypothetical protein ARAM_001860 [Aspergillus rambellii]